MKTGEAFRRNGVLKVMISGHGGQGVLDLGNLIAYQAMKEGDHVVYTPTYGPETRGGKVRCWVTASPDEIDSPIAEVLDVLLVLNKPSMDFIPQLRSGGLLLYNVSIIDRDAGRSDIRAVPVPGAQLAEALGTESGIDASKALNCIMYGCFLFETGWGMDRVVSETEETLSRMYQGFKARFMSPNMAAVVKGYQFLAAHPDGKTAP